MRVRALDGLVGILLASSLVIASTIQHSRLDIVQVGSLQVPRLLLFQTLGVLGLLLFGVGFMRRPGPTLGAWLVLPLAFGTLLVLVTISIRVSLMAAGGSP